MSCLNRILRALIVKPSIRTSLKPAMQNILASEGFPRPWACDTLIVNACAIPNGTMKASESILIAMAWAPTTVAPRCAIINGIIAKKLNSAAIFNEIGIPRRRISLNCFVFGPLKSLYSLRPLVVFDFWP